MVRRARFRQLASLTKAAMALGVVLVILAWVGDRLLPPVAERVLAHRLPWRGGRVEIGAITRHGLHGATATAVRLIPDTTGDALVLDSVTADFAIGELLSRHAPRIRRLVVFGMHIKAFRGAVGWTWIAPFLDDTAHRPPGAGGVLAIDRLEVRDGDLVAKGRNGLALLTMDSLTATATGVRLDSAPRLRLDRATARARHAALGNGWLRVVARGSLAGRRVQVDTATVMDTAGHRLGVVGSVVLNDSTRHAIDLHVSASRFLVGQLHPTLSHLLVPGAQADLRATVSGTIARPVTDARIDFGTAGRVRATSQLAFPHGTTRLDVHAAIESLDVAGLTGGRFAVTPVQGRVDGRLDVTDPDSVDGPVVLDVRSRAAGRPIGLTGRADFVRGQARLSLNVVLPGITARLRGTVRPVGADTFDLQLALHAALPIPALVASREPGWRGPWKARARLSGRGMSPERMVAALRGDVATVGATAGVGSGSVRGRIADGTLRLSSRVTLGDAVVDIRGDAELRDPLRHWTVRRLDIRNFPLEPWLGAADAGRLAATLSARGDGAASTGQIRVDSVAGGRLAGLRSDLSFTLTGGRVHVQGRTARGTTSVEVDTLVFAGKEPERVTVSFSNLDPALALPTLAHGSLNGRLAMAPQVPPAASDSIRSPPTTGRLILDSSAFAGRPLAGVVKLRYTSGDLSFDGSLASADQVLELRGGVRPWARPFVLRVERGRIANVDPSAWSAGRFPAGRVNGTVRADIAGFDPRTTTTAADVSLDSSSLLGLVVDHGLLSLTMHDGHARLTGTGRAGRVAATVTAQASSARDTWSGHGSMVLTDPAEDSADSLPLRFDFSMSAGARQVVLAGHGAVAGVPLDSVAAAIEWGERGLNVTRLVVTGPDVIVHGAGRVPRRAPGGPAADLTVTGSAPGLGALMALTGRRGYRGHASFRLRSTGSPGNLRHELHVAVGGFRSGSVRFDSAVVDVSARPDSQSWLANATARITVSGRRPALVSPGGTPIAIGLGTVVAADAPDATTMTLDLEWDAAARALRLSDLQARLGVEQWRLERPATMLLSDGLDVRDLIVRSPAGRITAAGRVSRHGPEDLTVDITGLPMQLRNPGATGAFTGRLDLVMRLIGPAEDPHLTVTGGLGGLTGEQRATTIDADWTKRGLRFRVAHPGDRVGHVAVGGDLPLGLSLDAGRALLALTDDAVDLHFEAVDFELADLEPALGPERVAGLEGRLSADVHVTGTPDAPQFAGALSVNGFRMWLVAYGTKLTADRLSATLAAQRLTLGGETIRSEQGGALQVTGWVDFPALTRSRLGLQAVFDRFTAAENAQMEATVSGELALQGTLPAPRVSGAVRLDAAAYQVPAEALPGDLAKVELTEADYREVARRFGTEREGALTPNRVWEAATVDVTVSAQNNVWARRSFEPSMAVEVAGEVRLRKQPDEALHAEGEVRVVEGRSFIQEFGRHFTITRGLARFAGPIRDVELEARANYRPDETVTINLDVRGDPEGLTVTLSSDPTMDETDIIWYIAVGRPASEISPISGGSGLGTAGAGVALSRVGAGVQEMARRTLGLDVVEVRQDGLRGLTFVAGRYVTRRLYVGFVQPVTLRGRQQANARGDDVELDADYRASTWLLVNLSGSRSLARFFLKTSHAY